MLKTCQAQLVSDDASKHKPADFDFHKCHGDHQSYYVSESLVKNNEIQIKILENQRLPKGLTSLQNLTFSAKF